MENEIMNATKACVPELAKNMRINISMEGWPASAAIIGICVSFVAVYGMKTFGSKDDKESKVA